MIWTATSRMPRESEINVLAVYFDSRVAFGLREAGVDEPKCHRDTEKAHTMQEYVGDASVYEK